MDKYFGYARKSPDDKEDTKTSIDNQIELIKKTANELGVELSRIFIDENISGSDRERKEFCEMRDKLYSSDVCGILVKEQDRFARDSSFFRDTLIDFEARGKTIYSCMRKKFLSSSDLGDSVHSMIDDNYVLTQRKKAELLFEQKKEKKLPISRPPFGYKMGKDKNYKIVKKDADIVRSVINDYVSRCDYKATIKLFKIDKSKYYRIIKNARSGIYCGWISYLRRICDSNKKVIRIEKVRYMGTFDHIVSEELWRKVNGISK